MAKVYIGEIVADVTCKERVRVWAWFQDGELLLERESVSDPSSDSPVTRVTCQWLLALSQGPFVADLVVDCL